MILVQADGQSLTALIGGSAAMFVGAAVTAGLAYKPVKELIARQERMYESVLRGKLLIDIKPRTATILSAVAMVFLAFISAVLLRSLLGALVGLAIGAVLPFFTLRFLHRRRLRRLENQLIGGIQTLASGVRAGLNLVQAMQMVAHDGPVPLKQEFAHLLREYEFGTPLAQAMDNAAERIGSADFMLLFSALQTHRERGGDLGQTLDRISESIREIQRLESRVRTMTAQGRATARWLGVMPGAVLAILYFLVDAPGVRMLFTEGAGNFIIFVIVVLNIAGFLWIKKIVSLDV